MLSRRASSSHPPRSQTEQPYFFNRLLGVVLLNIRYSRAPHSAAKPDQSRGGWCGGPPDDGRNSSRPTRFPSRIPTRIATQIESIPGQNPWMPTMGPNIMAAAMQAPTTTPVVRRTRQSFGYIFIRECEVHIHEDVGV